MKTKIYTYRNGRLVLNGEVEKIRRSPHIYLFCFGEMLNQDQILKLLGLKEARIEVFASYGVTIDIIPAIPSHYTYEIFKTHSKKQVL